MRVLIIEDDLATARSMELMLESERIKAYAVYCGEEGLDLAKLYDYDLVLLDLNLPDISGYDVLRRMRDARVSTPVMIVSGLSGLQDKVKGFALGADDYLTKPFHKDELVARIHAIVRRSRGVSQPIVSVGRLTVNMGNKTAQVDGADVHLTGKEYSMLELLTLRKGHVVTKEMFLNHLYGGRDEPEAKIIDVFVCKLRKKLGLDGLIETVWGRGFLLRDGGEPSIAPELRDMVMADRVLSDGLVSKGGSTRRSAAI